MEDINQGILLYKSTPNAVLIDLRDAEDYAEGHIPGAVITGHDSPVFCVSGFDSIVKPCGLWYNNEATGAKRGWPSCRLPKGKAAGVMV